MSPATVNEHCGFARFPTVAQVLYGVMRDDVGIVPYPVTREPAMFIDSGGGHHRCNVRGNLFAIAPVFLFFRRTAWVTAVIVFLFFRREINPRPTTIVIFVCGVG